MGITQMIHNAWLSIQKTTPTPSTPLSQNASKSSPSPTQEPQKTNKTPSFLGRLFSTTKAGIYNAFKPHNTTKAKTHDTRTKSHTRH